MRRSGAGRFGREALNSSNVCPGSSWTASQSFGPGFGMGSKLPASGAKARWRRTGNPLRSPIASCIVFWLGGAKAIAADIKTLAAKPHFFSIGLSSPRDESVSRWRPN